MMTMTMNSQKSLQLITNNVNDNFEHFGDHIY